jgi:hypothetical protein
MTDTKKELLLTLLALGVQNTEACSSEWFKRQKELLELLSPDRKAMVNKFYRHGYFVPSGVAWKQFGVDFNEQFDYDLIMEDWDDFYSKYGNLRKKVLELEPQMEAIGLIEDAFAYIDAFEG